MKKIMMMAMMVVGFSLLSIVGHLTEISLQQLSCLSIVL